MFLLFGDLTLAFFIFGDRVSICSTGWTGTHYVALAGLKLTMQTRLAQNSQSWACLCLLSAGMKGMCHHTWLFFIKNVVPEERTLNSMIKLGILAHHLLLNLMYDLKYAI